jgi:hypothetical protein
MNMAAYNDTWLASELDGTAAYKFTTHTPLGMTDSADICGATFQKRDAGIILFALPYVALTEIGPTVLIELLIGNWDNRYESTIISFCLSSPSGFSHNIVPFDPWIPCAPWSPFTP